MGQNYQTRWLSANMVDPDFRLLLEYESIVEDFLNSVDQAMKNGGVSRAELARRMVCSPQKISRIMKRITKLDSGTMVDIAHHLGLDISIQIRRV